MLKRSNSSSKSFLTYCFCNRRNSRMRKVSSILLFCILLSLVFMIMKSISGIGFTDFTSFIQCKSHHKFIETILKENREKYPDSTDIWLESMVPDDAFRFENVVQEPYDTVFNKTFSQMIGDYNNETACNFQNDVLMQKGLSLLHRIFEKERIPYMISYGSLLGYVRNKNIIPEDHDVDLFVPPWAHTRMMKYSSSIPVGSSFEHPILYVHPEFLERSGTHRSSSRCNKGAFFVASIASDWRCDFVTPIARLLLDNRFIDIWAGGHIPDFKQFPAVDTDPRPWHSTTGIFAAHNAWTVYTYPAHIYFPRRPCTFMGVKTWCPFDPVLAVAADYGPVIRDIQPIKICNHSTRKFVCKDDNPDLFVLKKAEWNLYWSLHMGVHKNNSSSDQSDTSTDVQLEKRLNETTEQFKLAFKRWPDDISFCTDIPNPYSPYLYSLCKDVLPVNPTI